MVRCICYALQPDSGSQMIGKVKPAIHKKSTVFVHVIIRVGEPFLIYWEK